MLELADELDRVGCNDWIYNAKWEPEEIARCIREAVNACEGDSNVFAAGDKAEVADAHYDDCDDVEGHHIIDVSDKFNENIAAIDWVREQGGLDAVKARLMPEGMEWPRFEEGEPVRIGDEVQSFNKGQTSHITSITFNKTGVHAGYRWCGKDDYTTVSAKALKRPAKVLDADGVEIREGDTVWDEHGDELVVLAVYGQDVHCRYSEYEDQICDNGVWDPSQLTHERPDSWERIEEDASKNPFDYCKDVGYRLDTCENAEQYKSRDLVRRAKLQYLGRINESIA